MYRLALLPGIEISSSSKELKIVGFEPDYLGTGTQTLHHWSNGHFFRTRTRMAYLFVLISQEKRTLHDSGHYNAIEMYPVWSNSHPRDAAWLSTATICQTHAGLGTTILLYRHTFRMGWWCLFKVKTIKTAHISYLIVLFLWYITVFILELIKEMV